MIGKLAAEQEGTTAAAGVTSPAIKPEAKELFDTVFDVNDDGKLSVSEVRPGSP